MKIKLFSLALFALAATAGCGAGEQRFAREEINSSPKKVETANTQKPADDQIGRAHV